MLRKLTTILTLAFFAGCGGGGSGGANNDSAALGSGSSTANTQPPMLLTFVPAKVSVNYMAGTSATVSLMATVNDPDAFAGSDALYAYIVDSEKILTGGVGLAQAGAGKYSVTVHTSATLAPGHYQGNFQIQLCADAHCARQFRGSPIPLPYDVTVTAATAPLVVNAAGSTQATMHKGSTSPASVTVTVAGDKLEWTASSDASWLQISGGAGIGNGSFLVNYVPHDLAAGKHTGSVTVKSKDGQTSSIVFSLDVLPPQFVLTSGVPNFVAINGANIAAQTLMFELNNKASAAWTAVSSAPWMLTGVLSGSTPGAISLQPDPTKGPLASGSYSSDIVLSSPGVPSKTVTASLDLVKAALSAPSSSIVIGGPKGRDLSAKSLPMSLNTGSRAWPWTMSALPAWLSSSTQSGTVNQVGTSLNFEPDLANSMPGSRSHVVTVSTKVNGDTLELPVTVNLNVDERKLLVSEWGVGFSSTPTGAVLTRTISVVDNYGAALPWTAVSNSAWLGVTASGTTGNSQIVLNANPASLPNGAISYAAVTVSTSTPNVSPAVIRVALWKDAAGAAAMTRLPVDYSHITADKIRPYIYANNGGTSIDIYHAYSAQKISTLFAVGAALGEMTVSPDGSRLYVLDTAARAMAVIDLTTMTQLSSWPLVHAVNAYTSVLAMRTNGIDIVLVGNGTAYSSGASLGQTGIFGALTASADGRSVFAQEIGFSDIAAFDVDYSAISGGILMVSRRATGWSINGAGNNKDIATSVSGSQLYTASGSPYRCSSLDPANLSLIGSLPGGDAYPNNAEVTVDGRAICGISGWYVDSDFWVHASNGALMSSYKVAGYAKALKDRQLVVTPDGLIVVAQTDDPLLAFVPIGK